MNNKKLGDFQQSLDFDVQLRDNFNQNHQLDSKIAKTAMSYIYRMTDRKIFKNIPQQSTEIKIAAQQLFAQNSNIVDVIGIDKQQLGYFMEPAMEDLENYCFRNNQSTYNLVAIFIQMALGLQQFHNYRYDAQGFKQKVDGWTHRDIKISNFLVFEEKDPNTASRIIIKLCDFGISTDRINNISEQGIGTLSYMSPEHFGNVPMTQKIDIWALGVAYSQLLTNSPLFSVSNDLPISEQFAKYGQLIKNFKKEDFPYKSNPQIRELILDMLSKDPQQRPKTEIIIQKLLKIQKQMFDYRINNDFTLSFTLSGQEFLIRFVKQIEQLYLFNNLKYGVDFLVLIRNEDVESQIEPPQNFEYLTYCRHYKYIGLRFQIGYHKHLLECPINLLQRYSYQNCWDIVQIIIAQFNEQLLPFIINDCKALKKNLIKYFQKELVDSILERQVYPNQNFVLTLFYLSLKISENLQDLIKKIGNQNIKNMMMRDQIQILKYPKQGLTQPEVKSGHQRETQGQTQNQTQSSVSTQAQSQVQALSQPQSQIQIQAQGETQGQAQAQLQAAQVQDEPQISELAQFIQKGLNIEQRVKLIYKLYMMIKKNTYMKFQYIYLYFEYPCNKTMPDVNKAKKNKNIDNLVVSIFQPEYRKLIKNSQFFPSYTEFMQFSFFTAGTQVWDVYKGYSQLIKDIFSDSDLYQQYEVKSIISIVKQLHEPILEKNQDYIEIIFKSLLNQPDQLKVHYELTDLFSSISFR
ncbi:hypothetical protein pb186bvf_016148 [Paramecium bursaria]